MWEEKWDHVARMWRGEVHTGFWWGRLGRPRRVREGTTKMDLQERRWGIGWFNLGQDRVKWRAQ
jgi:hypothetical protein